MPTLLKGLLSSVSALLVLLGFVELGMRATGVAPLEKALAGKGRVIRPSETPGRIYELTPGAAGTGWGTEVRVNSFGFRDDESTPGSSEQPRIVAIGDSITFGNMLAVEDTYAEQLQQGLSQRLGASVEVLNLGVGGYDTWQEVATLEEVGLQFQPDIVVVGFCVNDLGVVSVAFDNTFTASDRGRPLFYLRSAQLWHAWRGKRASRNQLAALHREAGYAQAFAHQIEPIEDPEVLRAMESLAASADAAPQTDVDGSGVLRRIPPTWFASEARVGRLQAAFDRLAELGTQHGFETVIAIIPYLEPGDAFAGAYDIVERLASRRGFHVLRLDQLIPAQELEGLRILAEDPVHPDARGHARIALELEGLILERGLLADS